MSTLKVDEIQDSGGNYTKQQVVQVVNVTDGEVSTGTTTTTWDDTIPQNTEGNEFMTLAITPKSATNILKIEVIACSCHTASANAHSTFLFQDSIADALACVSSHRPATNYAMNQTLIHYMVAGTTSATTFKVRVGADSAGTMTFNGQSSGRKHAGKMSSSITITEYQPSS